MAQWPRIDPVVAARAKLAAERVAWERDCARRETTLRQRLLRFTGFLFGLLFVAMVLSFAAHH